MRRESSLTRATLRRQEAVPASGRLPHGAFRARRGAAAAAGVRRDLAPRYRGLSSRIRLAQGLLRRCGDGRRVAARWRARRKGSVPLGPAFASHAPAVCRLLLLAMQAVSIRVLRGADGCRYSRCDMSLLRHTVNGNASSCRLKPAQCLRRRFRRRRHHEITACSGRMCPRSILGECTERVHAVLPCLLHSTLLLLCSVHCCLLLSCYPEFRVLQP